jgi:CheY-like chemotaxis protein
VLPRGRILLVEDNPANQKVARIMLEKCGCDVTVVGNGREALERLCREPFELVFMDCQMPEMDGYDATRRIRVMQGPQASVPIVAMTAHAMQGDPEKCLAAGMNEYTSKPVSKRAIQSILGRYFGERCSETLTGVSKALIVDDDPGYQETIRKGLRRFYPAARIRVAGDGIDACTLLGSFLPDLLVCDIVMPNLEGAAVIRYLRDSDRYARTRIVVVTSLPANDPRVAEVRRAGVDGILAKPFQAQALYDVLAGVTSASMPVLGSAEPPPILDATVLPGMLGDDLEALRDVIATYRETFGSIVDELERAVRANDTKRLAAAAHSIKGGAANLGGLRLKKLAAELEASATRGDPLLDNPAPSLRTEIDALLQALDAYDWRQGPGS